MFFTSDFNNEEIVLPDSSFDKCPFGPTIRCFNKYGYLEYLNNSGE